MPDNDFASEPRCVPSRAVIVELMCLPETFSPMSTLVSVGRRKALTWKTFRMTVQPYGMFATITAVLDSRVYQNNHSDEKGSVKDKCLDSMAQTMVKNPSEKGKTRSNFFFRSR